MNRVCVHSEAHTDTPIMDDRALIKLAESCQCKADARAKPMFKVMFRLMRAQ